MPLEPVAAPVEAKEGRPYMLFKCLPMIFNGCLQPNIFSVKTTSVYFLPESLSTWQFFLQRTISSGTSFSLDKCFLRPAAGSTEPPSDCVPGPGSPPVHTQPALKVTGGLGYVQWATEWKGERNMFLLLPNTMSLCILWIEAGSACACPWAAVEGWRMWNWWAATLFLFHLCNQSIASTTAAQRSWTQTTAISHTVSKAFQTATCCGYIPREAAAGQVPDKRNHLLHLQWHRAPWGCSGCRSPQM